MGFEIVYCHNCKSRLTGKDFEKGKAFRIENSTVCLDCARKVLESLPPAERDAFAAKMKSQEDKKTSSARLAAIRPSETGSSTRVRPAEIGSSTRLRMLRDSAAEGEPPPEEEAAPRRSKALLLGIGGAVALVAIVVLAVVLLSGRPSGKPAGPTPPPGTTAPPVGDVRPKEAQVLLDAALAYQKTNPDDFTGQLDRLTKAKWAPGGAALAESIGREIEKVQGNRKRKVTGDLDALEGKVKPLLDGRDFDGAARLVEEERTRHADDDWTFGIKRLADQVERQRNAPPSVVPPSAEAWAALDPEEMKASSGAALKKLDDRSVLGPRAGPDQDSYAVAARSDLKGITAFRLDALADASLPARGPGRSENGNFVLSEFRVEVDGRALAFKGASSSWEQNGWPSSAAIDGDSLTGWAIQPRSGRDHEAVFHLQEPVDGGKFTFTLECLTNHPRHVLGRFRISATSAKLSDPPGPRRTEKSTPQVAPAVRAYRDRWRAAALHAVARDYDAAVRQLEGIQAGVTDPALKSEAAADLADLKLAAALHAEVQQVLLKWPAGQNLPAEILAADGRRVRVDEPVRRTEKLIFEVRPSSDARALGAGELLAASLAEVFLARGKPTDADRRAAGIFCAIEGDADAARRHLGGNLPDKYEEHARLLQSANPGAEAEARRKLREAVDGFFDPGARASSLSRFAALLREHKDALVVRRSRAALEAGPEALAEYAYAVVDLKASGQFALQALPKGEFAWVMGEDVPEREQRREHAVEAAYSAPAGSEYRAWVLAGGCCQETFAFFIQANDLEVPGETTGIPVRCDPDSTVMAPVAHGLSGLKKNHAAHGGPKAPARFEWVALPALKHPQGGTKRIRLVSDQQGFAVAGLLVSSARKAAPKDDEWRAIEARRPRALDLLDPQSSSGAGWINREVWRGIGGDDVERLTGHKNFQGRPTEVHKATSLEGDRNKGDDFGTRMRGYLLPPHTGPYVFWICADDTGELWLSTDDGPENKKKIAFVKGAVGFDSWQDQPSQRSPAIRLVQGRRYYFEVLHKDGKDKDHIRVGWKIPEGPDERPIPGNRLAPYAPGQAARLGVTLTSGPPPTGPQAASTVVLAVEVSGASEVSRVEIFQGGRRLGEPKGSPLTYTWTRVPEGAYDFSARVAEKGGRVGVSAPLGVSVGEVYFYRAVDLNGPSGSINRRLWAGRETGGYAVTGTGHERLDVDLKPPTDPAHARMIRSSVFAKEGTKVAMTEVPQGKYQVYLTVWEPRETPQGFEVQVNGKTADAEVKFAAAGEWCRLGPWLAEPVNGRIEVAAARGSGCFSGIELWSIGPPPSKPTQRVKSEAIGGGGGGGFEEAKDGDPFLIGFKVSKKDFVKSLQGIWDGKVMGERMGGPEGPETEILAKPGYAVGGLRVRGGDRVRAFKVIFMKIVGPVLNPSDSYESEWYVGNEADTKVLGGDGSPVVGLHGRRGGDLDALGIVQLK